MDYVAEWTVEQEIADVQMRRPHVVILGAGASRAACPCGDKFGRPLPLMADFSASLGLSELLRAWDRDPAANFEDTYSLLHDAGEAEKLEILSQHVERYFGQLELPDEPTLYDHLVLSLRSKDLIATFNWDPLLMQAYLRNSGKASLPQLAFLHGNVRAAYCERDSVTGLAGSNCRHCGEAFARSPLLYPVREKNYATDPFIASQWALLEHRFRRAFMITVFGYSGPKTDAEAIRLMSGAWGSVEERRLEQTSFITKQTDAEVREAWNPFIHSHHYEVDSDFYDSWIAKHPRRTGEAYHAQYIEAQFIGENPIPRAMQFPELWAWYGQFHAAEARP